MNRSISKAAGIMGAAGMIGIAAACVFVMSAPAVAKVTRCSLATVPLTRSPAQSHFVALATPDTVPAGMGNVVPSVYGGHSGSGTPRIVYGQIFRVVVPGAVEVAPDAVSENAKVVLVPWDYDPACEPTYWGGSARWSVPGIEGFYTATLRARVFWVDGLPTYDAFFAAHHSYPRRRFGNPRPGDSNGTADGIMTARQFMTLYEALPAPAELREGSTGARDRLRAWMAANAEQVRMHPASEILEVLSRTLLREP